ncbi:hypothetical protein B9Z47_04750 [Limnohabitans sp. 2KL-1]|uniref:DUF3348 family protein n=1 Tax=Limnohabitans sp. 2KL-1 TaxID=1100699 RepID=UPI000D383DA6|nr:DUF3348 family protein [Limnohabitans sp. 2KL-1]PUE48845.1 hypothetical protein B9Z47_04750 [Limnohabitans sp. 2KL-1]
MTQAPARAPFNSSRLTRFLTENAMLNAAQTQQDVGQQLGDWLNFRQAIALHGVLHPEQATPHDTPAQVRRAATMSAQALRRHAEKVRAQLEQSIQQGAPTGSGLARIDMPPPTLDEPLEPKTAYEPYRRFHAAHQRQMETSLHSLRSQVRGQLGKCPGPLQQLATLDAAFENILGEREAMLLGKVAKLLEKGFAQAVKQHIKQQAEAHALVTTEAAHAASTAVNPGSWLMAFRQTLRTALLAELDTRLQPTLALLEAFESQTPQEQ